MDKATREKQIQEYASIMEFFHAQIKKRLAEQDEALDETTEFYVVQLLASRLRTQEITQEEKQHGWQQTPLAILYAKAFSTTNSATRFQLLKKLGDQSLYTSGFFGDALARDHQLLSYYTSMGQGAYHELSRMSREKAFVRLFTEITEKFSFMVLLLTEISQHLQLSTDQQVMKLYERWLATKSDKLRQKLLAFGFDPLQAGGHAA